MISRKYIFDYPVIIPAGKEVLILGWCRGKQYVYGTVGPFQVAVVMEGVSWDELSCCKRNEVLLQARFLDYERYGVH